MWFSKIMWHMLAGRTIRPGPLHWRTSTRIRCVHPQPGSSLPAQPHPTSLHLVHPPSLPLASTQDQGRRCGDISLSLLADIAAAQNCSSMSSLTVAWNDNSPLLVELSNLTAVATDVYVFALTHIESITFPHLLSIGQCPPPPPLFASCLDPMPCPSSSPLSVFVMTSLRRFLKALRP